jgi:uncharacterized protein
MKIPRLLEDRILTLSKNYPVVTVTGPRQSGKTTLTRAVFPERPYVNLESPDIREFARTDPRGFLAQYPRGAILDEIQHVPELLSYIQVLVDERQETDLFILTGSEQFRIRNSISQSLAGRTGILRLLPFSLEELEHLERQRSTYAIDSLLYRGFYPRIHTSQLSPSDIYRDYFETYIERDIRQLTQISNLSLFQKFIALCAGRVGQLLNMSSLGNDVGISHTTAREWLSLLEASYIIFLLPPYFANLSKRLIKSPKLYFYDVGLATYLLRIEREADLAFHPLKGNLFENMVIMEALKSQYNRGLRENIFFYRDSHGVEIDLLFGTGPSYRAIEIKSAQTFIPDFMRSIQKVRNIAPEVITTASVIYGGEDSFVRDQVEVTSWRALSRVFKEWNPR